MQVALQLDDRAERNKNKKKHHTRQVSDVLRYDRVWLCSADPETAKSLVIMEVVNRVSEILPAQISMSTAWSLLETIGGVDLDRFVPMIGVSSDVAATKLARKFASDVLESKGEVVNRTLFVATPKCVFSVLYCIFAYLKALLLLREDVFAALNGVALRAEALAVQFPNDLSDRGRVSTWTVDNFKFIVSSTLQEIEHVFGYIVLDLKGGPLTEPGPLGRSCFLRI